ncbi:hypothetical protein ACX10_08115 [Vibrio parahaemolyticus]|nr:hypothetical protein ACX10_08115 [Vibrio parahaemolyticus]
MALKCRILSELMPEKTKFMPAVILCIGTPAIRQVLRYFTKDKVPMLILKATLPTTEILSIGNIGDTRLLFQFSKRSTFH